jgi:hypothetical protein
MIIYVAISRRATHINVIATHPRAATQLHDKTASTETRLKSCHEARRKNKAVRGK